jgi:hypothetical protein
MIRWRYGPENKDTEQKNLTEKHDKQTVEKMKNMHDIQDESLKQFENIESNGRIIEWSDGSLSFACGDELFDVRTEDLHNSCVFVKCDSEIAVQKAGLS